MRSIWVIANYTFREYLKGRIILSVLFLSFILFLASYGAAELSYKTVNRVAVDIGFGLATISAISMSIFLGVTLISNEIESRTLYMVLSKPVSRVQFFIGKFFGLSAMTFINVFILVSQTFVLNIFFGGSFDQLFLFVSFMIFIEALIVLSVTILFSLFTNKYLSIFFVLILYVVGHALDATVRTRMVGSIESLKAFLYVIEFIVPMFYKLNFKDFLIYKSELPTITMLKSLGYGVFYLGFVTSLNLLIFNRKDLD